MSARALDRSDDEADSVRAAAEAVDARCVLGLLGIALGLIAGGAALEAGVLVLLLLIPAILWASREKARPLGLGGLIVGLGAGMAGLLALANARCAASNVSGPNYSSACVAPDITPFLVVAAALVVFGAAVTLVALTRRPADVPGT